MRVEIDTNVLVSAAIRDADPEVVVLFAATAPGLEWIASPSIMEEYIGVVTRRKFGLDAKATAKWRAMLASGVRIVATTAEVKFEPDPGDAKFLACALAATADFLITGDRALRRAGRIGDARIVSVSEFRRTVIDPPATGSNGA